MKIKPRWREVLDGFVIGILISVGWIIGSSDLFADDHTGQFVVLDADFLIEGTNVLTYTIMDTDGGVCYRYAPSTTIHDITLEVVLCPALH